MNDTDIILQCSNCDIPLLEIVVIPTPSEEKSVRCNCPKCGDKSYVRILNTKFVTCPAEPFRVVDEDNGFYTLE